MLIIAQDPGKKTGIATWADTSYSEGVPAGFNSLELTVEEYFEWMATNVASLPPETEVHFVSESFIITAQTAKNTQAGWSLELIGVMKFIAWVWFRKNITMQAPNIGKTFGTDGKLKQVGWHVPGKGHANDAARHLMTYAAQRKLVFDVDTLKGFALND